MIAAREVLALRDEWQFSNDVIERRWAGYWPGFEWANMLEHELPSLPPFAQFWSTLDELFACLSGEVTLPTLPRAQTGGLDPDWTAPPP